MSIVNKKKKKKKKTSHHDLRKWLVSVAVSGEFECLPLYSQRQNLNHPHVCSKEPMEKSKESEGKGNKGN